MVSALAAFSAPSPAVVCNVDAVAIDDPEQVRSALIRQIDSPVRWVESIATMNEAGVSRFVEIGPGRVLTGLVKRMTSGVELASISSCRDLEKLES